MQNWQCRWSPTLGSLERTHQEVWGTKDYENDIDPTVFMGLYGLPDFYALWKHKGEKHVLWCGSDIRYFVKGYWLDNNGRIKINSAPLAKWMNENCESWTENEVEARELRKFGISSKVCPSFLGNVNEYEISFKPGNKVYASVSGDDFELYRWSEVDKLASLNPKVEFHLYGNTKEWKTSNKNVIVHGRVPKEQMNSEIKEMQGGLRLLEFDGASEVLIKSVLWGQWPISTIQYPHMLRPNQLSEILTKTDPNLSGRDYFIKTLNNYPWNKNK